MRSWIGVHLPLLPLESLRPCWSGPGRHVILDREHVTAMSPQAAHAGVRIGMRRAGVQMICPDAALHERDQAKEREALDSIALALLQYTPEVAFAEHGSLLLDVTASLRAFGGRLALVRLVRRSVDTLGFTPQVSMAPTAQGAWLLAVARSGRRPARRRTVRMNSMMRLLDALPCTLLPQVQPYLQWLEGIGCKRLADLRRLPRSGLLRRCGQNVLDALDRAYGQAAELHDWIQPPQHFAARLELPDRIEHAESALFAARRLLLQMTGWLVARQLAVSRFLLLLEHERGRSAIAPTPLEIALADPAWQEEHLTRLLKERLARTELVAPVIGLRLEAVQFSAMLPPSESLFPEPGGTPVDFHRLLELLKARLGDHGVLAPAPQADHRPEISNAWAPDSTAKHAQVQQAGYAERPFWLLRQPIELIVRDERPFYGSTLRTVKGPERIECGWWDGRLIMRDYFVAQAENSKFYWIYRERHGVEVCWFLQGLFG